MSVSAQHAPSPAERRSGCPRRRAEPTDLVDVFRPDDRRLGLGRRWDDWRRPAGHDVDMHGADLLRT